MSVAQEASTVRIRVQVIDMRSFTLDLEVPTYRPAKDVTQRIARDAGLAAHWEDRSRRLYWLRARGRVMQDEETLADLGVVNGELVYLLPEPRAGSSIQEQPPEYPRPTSWEPAGWLVLGAALFWAVAWSVGWGFALLYGEGSPLVLMLPSFGLGLLSAGLARHAWGGRGNQFRIGGTGAFLFALFAVLAILPGAQETGAGLGTAFIDAAPSFLTGLAGVLIGWLAWWGPVEPLPEGAGVVEQVIEAQPAQAVASCAICSLPVGADVMLRCPNGCGAVFHTGCHRARASLAREGEYRCPSCQQMM